MELTEDQKAVVALDEGRHLVLAPPGSGKTEMLSQRILRAVRAGVDPGKMLCATFTNRAAFEMRSRIDTLIGDAQCPEVGNLHHFCLRFLRSVGLFPATRHILDEVEQLEFVKEVADTLREELRTGLRSDRRVHGVTVMGLIKGVLKDDTSEVHVPRVQYLHEILEEYFASCTASKKSPYPGLLSAVGVAHQQRIGIPRRYVRAIPPDLYELDRNGVTGALARAYNGLKRKFNSSDFDDLINETFLFLEDVPLAEGKRFDWILIDEVQDLNPLQWRIVHGVTSARAVSVYFGDVEQAIFSFLGASGASFAEAVCDCKRHYLRTNFRATPLLLEILMRYSLDALCSEWTFLPRPVEVERANGELLASPSRSTGSVLGNVRRLLESGTAEEVAILVRRNVDVDALEDEVRRLGYRYAKVSGVDLFAFAPMRDFLAFVSVLAGSASRTHWTCILRRFAAGVPTMERSRYLVREMFACGFNPMELWRNKRQSSSFFHLGNRRSRWAWKRWRMLSSLRSTLDGAMRSGAVMLDGKASFRSLFNVFAHVAFDGARRYSFYELFPEGNDPDQKAEAAVWERAIDHARERIEKFLRYTDFVCRDDRRPLRKVLEEDWEKLASLGEADLLVGDERIVLSTIHKAKGRQFDAVVVPDVEDVLKEMGGEHGESDRLLYVAMSRAKRHLSLFGCPNDSVFRRLRPCFAPGYLGYYQRKTRGVAISEDWLYKWEVLAELDANSNYREDVVAEALTSYNGPLVRIALKVLRHHPDPGQRRKRYLQLLEANALPPDSLETLVQCFSDCGEFNLEAMHAVRALAVNSLRERVCGAALRYFRLASTQADLRDEARACLSVGLYFRYSDLRVTAAQMCADAGDMRWMSVVKGSSRDFERLGHVPAPEHEDDIRAILSVAEAKDGTSAYTRALRQVLFLRA